MKNNKLTLSFIPYAEIEGKSSGERVRKLLGFILKNRIIIMQGKLKPEEEVRLIEDTMALIGNIKNFRGVELAVVNPNGENASFFDKIRRGLANALVGQRDTLTIIGPASVVREIKKDPSRIDLFLNN